MKERTLIPEDNAKLGTIRFEDWLVQTAAQIPSAPPQTTGAAVTQEKESRKKAS